MQKNKAFTFIEILIALCIIAIMAGIALPNFKIFVENEESKIIQSQLVLAINTAKTLAQIHHKSMILCPSKNQRACSNNWLDGQIIFAEHSTHALKSVREKKTSATLHWRSYPKYRNYLLINSHSLDGDNGTFWFCQSANKPRWSLAINKVGRITINNQPSKDLRC